MGYVASCLTVLASAAPADRVTGGPLDVRIDPAGRIAVIHDGQAVVNYEMLQLVDTAEGWRVVYGYGASKAVRRQRDGDRLTLAETAPDVLTCTKRLSVDGATVTWDMSFEVAPRTGANRCFYFLDIPAEALRGAVYAYRTAAREGLADLSAGGSRTVLTDVRSVTFLTPRRRLAFELAGENVTWTLADWTATDHKSYRLRIEKAVGGEAFKASVRVVLRIGPSSPEAMAEARRKAHDEAMARRRARLAERGFVCDKPLRIGPIAANAESVGQYEKLELTFAVDGTFTNPFDPDQIDVTAGFRAPSGKRIDMPAFLFQEFEETKEGSKRKGDAVWKVRFAPTEPGKYAYGLVAKNHGREAVSPEATFTCTPGEARGYIRVSTSNPLYCEFANGEPYVPNGVNLFVSTRLGRPMPTDRLERCARWMNKLADAEGDFVRLRMDSWWLAIEMSPDEATGYLGPGYYHQPTCRLIDRLYELAAKRGLYVMHCLDNANGNVNGTRESWRRPYNLYLEENGGVCAKATDFWTNAEARRHVRNKLRYCVARWGWRPNLMAWEFFNEVACRADMIEAATAWHRDMARYLRRVDPHDHPITTSLMGDHTLAHRIWALSEMEIIQYHYYSRDEMTPTVMSLTREGLAAYGKPFFLGEYGVGPQFRPGNCEYDKTGIHMHNGMWAALFARGCGAGAMWYVSNYVDPFDLWFHYRGVARFAARVPWTGADLVPLDMGPPTFKAEPQPLHYCDFRIPTSRKFAFTKSPKTDFTIRPNGTVTDSEMIRPNLNVAPGRKSPPTFHVNLDRPGQFVVTVNLSVGDETNTLIVELDGKQVVEQPFPAGKEHHPKSTHVEQYDNWKTPYDKAVVVAVPAGKHAIRCEATGKDRLEVGYTLRGAIAFERTQPMRAYGFRTRRAAYLWLQNASSTWWTAWEGRRPIALADMTATVRGLADGAYKVEWFDTWEAKTVGTQDAVCRDGVLTLDIPKVNRDVACIVEAK